MNTNNFITELKRRNVFRVATAYAIAGWLVIQIFDTVSPQLGFPEWVAPLITVGVLIGLPLALVFAWAFELTPEGIRKSKEVEITQSVTDRTGKKLNGIIITVLSVAVVFLLVERVFFAESILVETDTPSLQNISDKSIAVLPFDDFNAGGQQEYFADGLTEEILNSLAKTPDLLVASRTSSFQYKDKNVDVIRIADTLGVAHVLEGSVRESADKYRITAQLIRASDGFHLWSETYDRPKTDIIDIQEDIAFQIATALETAMDPEALREMVEVGTSSIEAYSLYMEGISMLNKSDIIGKFKEAFDLFEQARAIDPEFADAHYQSALVLSNDMNLTSMGSGTLGYGYEQALRMIHERLSKAIQYAKETDRVLYLSTQAFMNLELRKSLDYLSNYLDERPSGINNYDNLVYRLSSLGEYELARDYHMQAQQYILDNEFDISGSVAFYFWSKNWMAADPWMEAQLNNYPYSEGFAYQAHRIMLWRGEYDRAREIKKRLRGINIPKENFAVAELRQACADGRDELASQIYNEEIEGRDLGSTWISLRILGRDQEAYELLKPLDDNNELIYLAAWLYYPYFDHTQFPNLTRLMERENHKRGESLEIPYRCGR